MQQLQFTAKYARICGSPVNWRLITIRLIFNFCSSRKRWQLHNIDSHTNSCCWSADHISYRNSGCLSQTQVGSPKLFCSQNMNCVCQGSPRRYLGISVYMYYALTKCPKYQLRFLCEPSILNLIIFSLWEYIRLLLHFTFTCTHLPH